MTTAISAVGPLVTRAAQPTRLGTRFCTLIALLCIYPYVFVLNVFAPATLSFGKNTYVALATLVSVVVFLAGFTRAVSWLGGYLALVVAMLLPVLIIRDMLYSEPISSSIFTSRFPLMAIVYCGATFSMPRTDRHRAIVQRVIVGSALFQAVIGIVHDTFFPYVLTGAALGSLGVEDRSFFIGEEGLFRFRESGVLISPNVYAHFILVGLLTLAVGRKVSLSARAHALRLGVMFVMLWGISLSGSRLPLAIGVLAAGVYVLRHLSPRRLILGVAAFAFALAALAPALINIRTRTLAEGSGNRVVKAQLALSLLGKSSSNTLVGVSYQAQDVATLNGVSFSDNSYFTAAMYLGVPFVIVFAVVMTGVLANTAVGAGGMPLLAYLLVTVAVTNAIQWDIWLLYWFAALSTVSARSFSARMPRAAVSPPSPA